jgi:hypothetical protein
MAAFWALEVFLLPVLQALSSSAAAAPARHSRRATERKLCMGLLMVEP